MISVNINYSGQDVLKLTVSGHANYDNIGKDIVCAGVSAIVVGGINALENELDNLTIINEENKLGVIVNKSNENIQIILKTIVTQLKTIEESYKKFIKINSQHGGK